MSKRIKMNTAKEFKLVELLANMDNDSLADLAINLAQYNPEKFIQLVTQNSIVIKAINKSRKGNPSGSGKVQAVRELRRTFEISLTEAKFIVEVAMEKFSDYLVPQETTSVKEDVLQ